MVSADERPHAIGEGPQKQISVLMAQSIIDILETVEIEHHERGVAPIKSCKCKVLAKGFGQLKAVWQISQGIKVG